MKLGHSEKTHLHPFPGWDHIDFKLHIIYCTTLIVSMLLAQPCIYGPADDGAHLACPGEVLYFAHYNNSYFRRRSQAWSAGMEKLL